MINGTHINVFIMDNATKITIDNQNNISFSSSMKQLLYDLFSVMNEIIPNRVKMYPKLEELALIFYNSVCK
jgi:hypothetical protein